MIGESYLKLIEGQPEDTEIVIQVLYTPMIGHLKCQYVPMNIAFMRNGDERLATISNTNSVSLEDILNSSECYYIARGTGYEGMLTCGDIVDCMNAGYITPELNIIVLIAFMYFKDDKCCYNTTVYNIDSIEKIGNRIVVKCNMDVK